MRRAMSSAADSNARPRPVLRRSSDTTRERSRADAPKICNPTAPTGTPSRSATRNATSLLSRSATGNCACRRRSRMEHRSSRVPARITGSGFISAPACRFGDRAPLIRGARAAVVRQVLDQAVHRIEVGAVADVAALAFALHQPGLHQLLQVEAERGWGYLRAVAMSPAMRPAGPASTSSRKAARRVAWPRAVRAVIAFDVSIFLE